MRTQPLQPCALTDEPRGRSLRAARGADGSPNAVEGDSLLLQVLRDPTGVASVLLYWLPLGAGGHSVRWNGRAFEALVAHHEHRDVRDLYHSALEVHIGGDRYAIEMTPVWGDLPTDRGVVREGPVGSRLLGRSALFRYEVRCWRNGVIPDQREAVGGPRQVSHDLVRGRRILELVPHVPAMTWGRDELRTGDMWNSNSLSAWLLAASGHDMNSISPPTFGRAPGWHAGLVAAGRRPALSASSPIGCSPG
jgi:hypothetical protein